VGTNGVSGTQYVDGMTWGSNEFLNGGYVSMPVSADFQTFEYIYHAPSDANGLRFGPCVSGNTVLLIDDMKIEELKGVLTSDIASVTFAAADNSVSSVVKQYVKGETVTLSADILTKNGYEISFFEVVSGANTYTKNVGDTFVVTGNVTIKVNFIEKTRYTISYNSNGGIGSMESKTLYYDEPFTIPSCTYTKDKNEFTMWNESPLGNGAAYSAGEEIFLSHNIVLYALWKQTKFEVTLKAEGGNIVLGGGIYDKNDSVTLVASGNDGCIFLGWFINGAGSAVSTELSYTVKVENDVYYVAKFLNENLNTLTYLDVSLGGGKVSYSSYGKSGTWNSSIQKYGFSKGKQITLVAEANKDYTFVHWRDQKTGKVVSENATYSFILGSDVSLVALFVKSDSKYVVFLDRLGKVLKASGTMFGSIKAPTVNNTYIGYVFTGWDKSFDNVNGILVVNALYNKDETMYNVNVFGGYINRDSSKVSGSYLYDTRITVNAKVPTGKYFAGWSFDGGETIASYNESYSFNVGSDCSLTAVFSDTEVQEKPVIAITSMTRRWSEGVEKQQATFLSQWNVPNDCSIVESGFLRTLKSGYRENLSLEFADEINVKKTTSVRKVSTGQYQLNVNITDPLNKTVYIRAYLTYVENSTGKVVTIYSNCAVSTPVL